MYADYCGDSMSHPVNALVRRPPPRTIALPGNRFQPAPPAAHARAYGASYHSTGFGDYGLAPVAAVGPALQLLKNLGPSHTAQAIRQNKGKFDDLGQQAVTNPGAPATGMTNSGMRIATSKSALAWLQQIVNGPGFQGGPGTPFPDNPRDFLQWGPRASQTDRNRIDELNYAEQVLNGVQQTLSQMQAPPATAAAPPPPSAASAPPPVQAPSVFLPAVSPVAAIPAATSIITSMLTPQPAAPPSAAAAVAQAQATGQPVRGQRIYSRAPQQMAVTQTSAGPAQVMGPGPAPVNVSVTAPGAPAPVQQAGLLGNLPLPVLAVAAGALIFMAMKRRK